MTYAITYQKGNQALLFNKILTNFGYQFEIIPSGYLTIIGKTNTENSGESNALQRLTSLFFINFNLGFGVLIR
ncbi:MAG: hypothetical protein A3H98_10955 [Bacteroidetes bacterium RIFCSPLOWO2_02_FULL_36_8]|nr:MAG: hypothetical protein A3H98_10955 [Bacteroidetes bacterium RIFCSPLOWO2_02_FULL_36_8]OFY71252.1 MAG: hypothetical protein A3G23_01905 [Bacteroidetes bacterium RIFCSPLOWO2_12_FULL_37_12]